eukprot:7895113-Pyramimonas_sp.AAC.3
MACHAFTPDGARGGEVGTPKKPGGPLRSILRSSQGPPWTAQPRFPRCPPQMLPKTPKRPPKTLSQKSL